MSESESTAIASTTAAPERVLNHRYHIERLPGGFSIEAKDRCPVRLTMEKTHFRLQSEEKTCRYGLFEYRGMIQWIADAVMRRWRSPNAAEGPCYCPRWVMQMTGRALNARIHPLWMELMTQADQQVVAVQRRIFAATLKVGPVALTEELYRQRYLVADILKYPAAAIATTYVNGMAYEVPWILDRYPYAAQRRQGYDRWRSGQYGPVAESPVEAKGTDAGNTRLWIDLLEDWRALFSDTGQSYTSLDKTLMNLPGRVTPGLLCKLHKVTLRRPVLDRLELMLISAAAECRNRHHDALFAHAQRVEIAQAMQHLGEAQRRELDIQDAKWENWFSPRRTTGIVSFTRYLSDFPEVHHGRIVGLTQRAIRWHQEQAAGRYHRRLEILGLGRQTALPPIPLPRPEGVKFLATVGEIGEEATLMKHCVASYAEAAIRGHCYLFHIDHAGTMATVEVNREGRVMQAQGPHNALNSAATHGRHLLAEWGKYFPVMPSSDADGTILEDICGFVPA